MRYSQGQLIKRDMGDHNAVFLTYIVSLFILPIFQFVGGVILIYISLYFKFYEACPLSQVSQINPVEIETFHIEIPWRISS